MEELVNEIFEKYKLLTTEEEHKELFDQYKGQLDENGIQALTIKMGTNINVLIKYFVTSNLYTIEEKRNIVDVINATVQQTDLPFINKAYADSIATRLKYSDESLSNVKIHAMDVILLGNVNMNLYSLGEHRELSVRDKYAFVKMVLNRSGQSNNPLFMSYVMKNAPTDEIKQLIMTYLIEVLPPDSETLYTVSILFEQLIDKEEVTKGLQTEVNTRLNILKDDLNLLDASEIVSSYKNNKIILTYLINQYSHDNGIETNISEDYVSLLDEQDLSADEEYVSFLLGQFGLTGTDGAPKKV